MSVSALKQATSVLIAEDDPVASFHLSSVLRRAGFLVRSVDNGQAAWEKLKQQAPEVLITDWMMPKMDGPELIRLTRERFGSKVIIIMLTGIVSEEARQHALTVGADAFIPKPMKPDSVLASVQQCLSLKHQPTPDAPQVTFIRRPRRSVPFVGVCIGASTGGPPALFELFSSLRPGGPVSYFVVLHAPDWAIRSFAKSLQTKTDMPVVLASEGEQAQVGHVYVAPGDCHMVIRSYTGQLGLVDDPPVNFVHPAVDVLFQSAARTFGPLAFGVVLTGLGKDGARGCHEILVAGGSAMVQDPEEATAPFMPKAVLALNPECRQAPLKRLGQMIPSQANRMWEMGQVSS